MDCGAPGIDGSHAGRSQDHHVFGSRLSEPMQKRGFACAGFSGEKQIGTCVLHDFVSQVKVVVHIFYSRSDLSEGIAGRHEARVLQIRSAG